MLNLLTLVNEGSEKVQETVVQATQKTGEVMDLDLFNLIWDCISPFLIDILKLSLGMVLFSCAIRFLRAKTSGISKDGSNPYQSITNAFLGYAMGRGIPIIIKLSDMVINKILATMEGKM